jgi:toxin FitB
VPFLLDTMIVSELRRSSGHGALKAWHTRTPAFDLFVPAVVLTEIRMGIVALEQRGRGEDAARLERWFRSRVLVAYEVVALGERAAMIWGEMLMSPLRGRGGNFERDMMIAACAIAEGMIVATRNIRDFQAIDALFPLPGLLDPTMA